MKHNHKQKKIDLLRMEIMESMLASFKIEGISIAHDLAVSTLKKIEFNLKNK
ncbi:hypothetical protein [Pedobacter sp. UBA5917]|uniref:hypothetical protein n=1 Tax=Pedobacter sp. UBA5917 TaxID=1947061 RepID=UPI0025F87957|nr:hypothetical protein [Pedobacter sp. UBA5917]